MDKKRKQNLEWLYQIFIPVLIISFVLTGCSLQNDPLNKPDTSDVLRDNAESTNDGTIEKVNTSPKAPEVVEITDPGKLQQLWSNYIFDSIPTVCNTEFNDPSEIKNMYYLVSFALQRIVKDSDAKQLPPGPTTEVNIPSSEQVFEKINQYFNFKPQLNLNEELKKFSSSEKDTKIQIYCEDIPYDTPNPWDIRLQKVTYDTTNREYQIVLNSIANQKTGRVERITYIILQERDYGTLYFKSVKREYPVTNLVKISGAYLPLMAEDFGAEMPVYSAPVSIYGSDIGGKLLLRADRLSDQSNPSSRNITTFSIYNPQTNKVEAQVEMPQTNGDQFLSVRILPDKLIFKMKNRFYVTGLDLKKLAGSDTSLPDVLKKALDNKDFAAGYDVSSDLTKIVFNDKKGLYLYDLKSRSLTKLASPIPVQSKLIDFSYILSPYFSAKDNAIISALSGYEGYYGVMVLNPENPGHPYIERNISNPQSLDNTNVMYPLPDIEEQQTANGSRTFDIRMFNLETLSDSSPKQALQKIAYEDEINQQPYGSLDNFPVFNDKYLAYVAASYEGGQLPEELNYRIVRIDLETMKAKTLVTIQAGRPFIRALTKNGQVIFSYQFEREQGLGITKLN